MGYDDERIITKNEKWARNTAFNKKIDFLKALEKLFLKKEDYSANHIFSDISDLLYESADILAEHQKADRDWQIDNIFEELGFDE